MVSVQVRHGEVADAVGVCALFGTTWAQTYADDFNEDELRQIAAKWHSPEALKKQILNQDTCFLVAHLIEPDQGNEIELVGHAYANLRPDNSIWLSKLYVLPSAQKRGVGKALLDEVRVVYSNAISIGLEVSHSNVSAQKYYQNMGFNQTGQTRCGEGDFDTPAHLLSKAF